MVSIGATGGITPDNFFIKSGSQTPSVSYGNSGGNIPSGGTSLQQRLDAIDKGSPTEFRSLVGTSKGTSFSPEASSSSSLMSRLDALGTGELSPKFASAEKRLDFNA